MLEKRTNAELLVLIEEIALRHCTQIDRVEWMLRLSIYLKFSITWRTVTQSNSAIKSLWNQLDMMVNDMDVVVSMVSEFLFRAGLPYDTPGVGSGIWREAARSLAWPMGSKGLPPEMQAFTGKEADYERILAENPWAGFLYLLSMTDIVRKITPPEPTPAPSKRTVL